jgi:hypothetical protein
MKIKGLAEGRIKMVKIVAIRVIFLNMTYRHV